MRGLGGGGRSSPACWSAPRRPAPPASSGAPAPPPPSSPALGLPHRRGRMEIGADSGIGGRRRRGRGRGRGRGLAAGGGGGQRRNPTRHWRARASERALLPSLSLLASRLSPLRLFFFLVWPPRVFLFFSFVVCVCFVRLRNGGGKKGIAGGGRRKTMDTAVWIFYVVWSFCYAYTIKSSSGPTCLFLFWGGTI